MYITVKLVLKVNEVIIEDLRNYENGMKHEIYKVAGVFKKENRIFAYPYRYISNIVSWNSKQKVIDEATLYYKKKQKKHKAELDFSSKWSYHSYELHEEGYLSLTLGRAQGARILRVPFYVHDEQIQKIKRGTYKDMTIKERGDHWFAFILVEIEKIEPNGSIVMGIDIGLKNPAVAYLSDGHVKFFGNGRQLRFFHRSYRKKITMMQRQHQYKKLRNFDHRLSRILRNFDHQVSRSIIDYAVEHDVGLIKLEKLTGIHDRFNVRQLSTIYLWSYQRLQYFIEYKANLAGIKVQYVSPYNTSKRCPVCSRLNQANDRLYTCSCGFRAHRDLVGARNIMLAL